MGWLDGAAEFERRERPGFEDVRRIFGAVTQAVMASRAAPGRRKLSAPCCVSEFPYIWTKGDHVGIDEQPVWFGGMLNVFSMGRYQLRASLDDEGALPQAFEKFDHAAEQLEAKGGGVISIYYHPNEFVTTAFWDLNFAKGANPERQRLEETAAAHGGGIRAVLPDTDGGYVEHAKARSQRAFRDCA